MPESKRPAAARDVTRVLAAVERGEEGASDELLPLVYAELRQLAEARMAREPAGHTLQPTALVHEAYLRLLHDSNPSWDSRGHFFAAAAEAMRRILIERARKVATARRGGGWRRVDLDSSSLTLDARAEELLAVDELLGSLQQRDQRMARVVKLRVFAGLSVDEIASAIGTSERTVKRTWQHAKVWLRRELAQMSGGPT